MGSRKRMLKISFGSTTSGHLVLATNLYIVRNEMYSEQVKVLFSTRNILTSVKLHVFGSESLPHYSHRRYFFPFNLNSIVYLPFILFYYFFLLSSIPPLSSICIIKSYNFRKGKTSKSRQNQ